MAAAAAASAGPAASDFELKDLDGTTVRLSNYRDKQPVLLYFWALWCPSCRAIKPDLAKLRTKVKQEDMEILAINVGHGDSLERVVQYQKGHPSPYPVLYDSGSKVTQSYQVQGIPLFILISKEGRVIYRDHRLPEDISRYLSN
jgi:peroxiredoxin